MFEVRIRFLLATPLGLGASGDQRPPPYPSQVSLSGSWYVTTTQDQRGGLEKA